MQEMTLVPPNTLKKKQLYPSTLPVKTSHDHRVNNTYLHSSRKRTENSSLSEKGKSIPCKQQSLPNKWILIYISKAYFLERMGGGVFLYICIGIFFKNLLNWFISKGFNIVTIMHYDHYVKLENFE